MSFHLERALHYFKVSDFSSAIKEYSASLASLPTKYHFLSYSNQGLAYLNQQKVNQAIQCFLLSIKNSTEHYESYHNLAVAYLLSYQTNKYEEALKYLTRSLKIRPDFCPSLCLKAMVLLLRGSHPTLNQGNMAVSSEAEKEIQFKQIVRQARALIDQAIGLLNSDDGEPTESAEMVYSSNGWPLYVSGNLESSIAEYEKALKRIPSSGLNAFDTTEVSPSVSETLKAYSFVLMEYALVLERQGKIDLAVEYMEKSTKRCPTSANLFNLGVLYNKSSSFGTMASKAEQCFQRVIQLTKDSAVEKSFYLKSLESIGLLYLKQSNLVNGIKCLRKCLDASGAVSTTLGPKAKKQMSMCRYNLALALLRNGEVLEAGRHFKIVLEICPRHVEAEHAVQMIQMYLAANPGIKLDLPIPPPGSVTRESAVADDYFSLNLNSKDSDLSGFDELSQLSSIDDSFAKLTLFEEKDLKLSSEALFQDFESDLKGLNAWQGQGLSARSMLDVDFGKLDPSSAGLEQEESNPDFATADDAAPSPLGSAAGSPGTEEKYDDAGNVAVEVRIYPLEELQSLDKQQLSSLKGVIPGRLEESLADNDFETCFGVSRAQFHALDYEKQQELRLEAGLL